MRVKEQGCSLGMGRGMFSVLRNTVLATITGLALTSPARAVWLVDFNSPGFGNGGAHVEFFTPAFLTRDTTRTFELNIGELTKFHYTLRSAGTCTLVQGLRFEGPCVAARFSGGAAEHDLLTTTTNPDVYSVPNGGTLTFTNLAVAAPPDPAAAPEPASLMLLAVGLAGLGMVLRLRRTADAGSANGAIPAPTLRQPGASAA